MLVIACRQPSERFALETFAYAVKHLLIQLFAMTAAMKSSSTEICGERGTGRTGASKRLIALERFLRGQDWRHVELGQNDASR
jgi:hypothetical protein